MPQYVSLEQQGFFQPFHALGQAAASALGLIQQKQLADAAAKQHADQLNFEKEKFNSEKPLRQTQLDEAQLKLNADKTNDVLGRHDFGDAMRGFAQPTDDDRAFFKGQDLGLGSSYYEPTDAKTEAERFKSAGLDPQAADKAAQDFVATNPYRRKWKGITPATKWEELTPDQQRFMVGQVASKAEKAGVKGEIPFEQVAHAYRQKQIDRFGAPPPIATIPGMTPKKVEATDATGRKVEYASADDNMAKPVLDEQGQPSGFVKIGDTVHPQNSSSKLSEGDKALQTNTVELRKNLQQLRKVVEDHGNYEMGFPGFLASDSKGKVSGTTSNEAAALLKSLPYRAAISYAKIVDPATAAREGEVAAASKYAIPLGATTPNTVTLAAIDSMLEELDRRQSENSDLRQQQGLPDISLSDRKVTAPTAPARAGSVPTLWTQEQVQAHKGPFIWGPTKERGSR